MIPIEFDYYKPDTLEETKYLYKSLFEQEKKPIYYGGGTEIISLARAYEIDTKAVIDIKGIKECQEYCIKDNELVIGAGVTLTQIVEGNLFPLLSLAAKRIADHTIQDKITLGGNLAGTIIYNETSLPLMVSNSDVVIMGLDGVKTVPINKLFRKGINLEKGDLIIQVRIPIKYLSLPFTHVKRTKNGKIQYPIISSCGIIDEEGIKIAFSGVCEYAFRDLEIEKIINDGKINNNFNQILLNLPGPIIDNLDASQLFRQFMFKQVINETITNLKDELHA